MKFAIVTADDFGESPEVNQAVVEAHCKGVLTCASLMITARFADEAVRLAKKRSHLRVGLHLVLVDGVSVLERAKIPRLVDSSRRFPYRPEIAGLAYFPSPETKRQLTRECEAQIEAFIETGLIPDHLNSHHHLHLHPVIADIVVALACKYGIPAVRLPLPQPDLLRWKHLPLHAVMLPWAVLLRKRLRRAGVAHNRAIYGLCEAGGLSEQNWLRLIPRLTPGLSEIFCHPAKPSDAAGSAQSKVRHAEYSALISETVRKTLQREHVVLTTFSERGRRFRK